MFFIDHCLNLTILELLANNIQSSDNLIIIIDSTIHLQKMQMFNISLSSTFIFWVFNSHFTLSNSSIAYFYPQFIYATYASMNISECNFAASAQLSGVFSVNAFVFEFNVTFSITNCLFESLSNNVAGPVIFKF